MGQDPAGRDATAQTFDDLPPPLYRPRPRGTAQSIEAPQPAFDPAAAPAIAPSEPPPAPQPQGHRPQPHHGFDPLEVARRPEAAEAYLFGSPNAPQTPSGYAPQEHSFEATSSAPKPTRPVSKTMNSLGALISIALVVGVGIWGYRLAVRDVSGVPVVAALEGPMRIQPEDPGGELASYQGLTVNAVQAEGQAEPTADRLILAPKPIELLEGDGVALAPSVVLPITPAAPERPAIDMPADAPVASPLPEGLSEPTPDAPVIAEATIPAIRPPAKPANINAGADTQTDAETDAETVTSEVQAVVPEAAGETIAAPEPLDVARAVEASDAQPETAPEETEAVAVIPSDIAGVAKSARPLHRPDGFAAEAETQRAAQAVAVDSAVASAVVEGQSSEGSPSDGVAEIAPDALPIGTNLAQLGAYASAEIARVEWAKKAARFDDYMDGKSRVIQRAESGGRAFYRLRAHGFETINEARQFCAALLSENAECIAVVVRE
jgi:hypothetical protein